MEHRDLGDGGWVLHDPALFGGEEADALLQRLRTEVEWRQEVSRGHPFPRLNAWFADPGLNYSYSGVTHRGSGWPDWLLPVRQRVEAASGAPFNSTLLNRYRNGQDSIGFHTDAEPELGPNPVVATLSFGSSREFVLKRRGTGDRLRYQLGHGSLLVMGGSSQHHWLHAVPKTNADVEERISLTFRCIQPGAPAGPSPTP
jgi:alkylated DNA repair dioxygenase AlkB